MRNLALIPARQGSKGVPHKNVRPLCGKPLLVYSIEAAREAGVFEEIFVSTDSEEYASIAREAGASVPFLRSAALSGDTASSWDVAAEALEKYQGLGMAFDTVTLLQPTSPLRRAEDILAGFAKMEETRANAVVAVCETDHSPLWANTLPEDFCMENFIKPEIAGLPRQKLPRYYRINGALYIVKTEALAKTRNIYACGCYAVVMPPERSVDIDGETDFLIAEAILENNAARPDAPTPQ